MASVCRLWLVKGSCGVRRDAADVPARVAYDGREVFDFTMRQSPCSTAKTAFGRPSEGTEFEWCLTRWSGRLLLRSNWTRAARAAPSSIRPASRTGDLSGPLYGATFMEAFSRFWRKYATTSGRSSRSEYWWTALADFLIVFVLCPAGTSSGRESGYFFGVLYLVFIITVILPGIAVSVRRLHDADLGTGRDQLTGSGQGCGTLVRGRRMQKQAPFSAGLGGSTLRLRPMRCASRAAMDRPSPLPVGRTPV